MYAARIVIRRTRCGAGAGVGLREIRSDTGPYRLVQHVAINILNRSSLQTNQPNTGALDVGIDYFAAP